MKTMEESKMFTPIFIGRWTPKILFSLREASSPWRVAPPPRHRKRSLKEGHMCPASSQVQQ